MIKELPLSFVLCGPSNCGKTTLAGNLLVSLDDDFADDFRRLLRRQGLSSVDSELEGCYFFKQTKRWNWLQYRFSKKKQIALSTAPAISRSFRNFCRGVGLCDYPILCFPSLFTKQDEEETLKILRVFAAFGKNRIVVAITKMDEAAFDMSAFYKAKKAVIGIAKNVKFYDANFSKESLYCFFWCCKLIGVSLPKDLRIYIWRLLNSAELYFVPVFRTENLVEKSKLMDWQEKSLFDVMNHLGPVEQRRADEPPELLILKLERIRGVGTVVCGKVLSGSFKVGDELYAGPSLNYPCGIISSIESFFEKKKEAFVGMTVGLGMISITCWNRRQVQTQGIIGVKGKDPLFSQEMRVVKVEYYSDSKVRLKEKMEVSIYALTMKAVFVVTNAEDSKEGIFELEPLPKYLCTCFEDGMRFVFGNKRELMGEGVFLE